MGGVSWSHMTIRVNVLGTPPSQVPDGMMSGTEGTWASPSEPQRLSHLQKMLPHSSPSGQSGGLSALSDPLLTLTYHGISKVIQVEEA